MGTEQRRTLRAAAAIFGPLTRRVPTTIAHRTEPSRFEMRVGNVLRGLAPPSALRELTLDVNTPLALRKFIDGIGEGARGTPPSDRFLGRGGLVVRYDFAWWDEVHRCLRVVEVDGEQHVRASALFDSATGSFEKRARRDAFKAMICAMAFPRVVMFRIGPTMRTRRYMERDVGQALERWVRTAPEALAPVESMGFAGGSAAMFLADSRTRRHLQDAIEAARTGPEQPPLPRRSWSR